VLLQCAMELNSPWAAVFAVWDAAELVEYNTNGFFIPLSILVTNQKVSPELFRESFTLFCLRSWPSLTLPTHSQQGYCTAGNHSGDLGGSGNLEWAESCSPQRPCEAGRLTFSGKHTGSCITDGSKPLASGEKPLGCPPPAPNQNTALEQN